MKKVNPEDLVVGQECYIKVKFARIGNDYVNPLILINSDNDERVFSLDQPIYTAEPSSDRLKMVVEVATALYVAHGTTADGKNTFMPDRDQIAHEALELITACEKAIKEGER